MSSGAQDDSPSQQPAARRTSFGRALDRFKTVFSRKRSGKAERTTEVEASKPQATATGTAVEHAGVAPAASSSALPSEPTAALEVELEVDDAAVDDFDDTEEPIIPVDGKTHRQGISEEKARLLFERYGLRYPAAKRTQQEPPNKIRRVEKPVRIRLHWSCHKCNTAFAQDKECSSCGHGRCDDCHRSPPQRVLRILEKTKREKEAAEIRQRAAAASPEDDAVTGPSLTMLASRVPVDTKPETSLPPAAEQKPDTEPLRFVYTIRSSALGGAGGLELYHMSRAYNRDVLNPGIQRVFKQPRMRVRWSCHRCDAIFTNRERCSTCQHEKCGDCTRSPPKREKPLLDPAILQSVEARLAGNSPSEYQSQLVSV